MFRMHQDAPDAENANESFCGCMLPLPHVRPVPPDPPRQTPNQPRVEMPSRTDNNVVGVLLTIQSHEPGKKGNRKVRDDRDIRTATHLADGAAKEVVDATVSKVEQDVHRLEGTLRQGKGVECYTQSS